jgi:murein L,D-transpeptidase YafK
LLFYPRRRGSEWLFEHGIRADRTGTVRSSTVKHMEARNMDRAAPILIRIYKEESTLEIWKQDRSGTFALLNSYPICKFSGNLGPKLMQGDHQAPEGFYDITPNQMNPNSSEYLAFNTGFPNAFWSFSWANRQFSYGAWRLSIRWLLRHDRLRDG